jgi:ribosome-binding protein aMBF1 (putative translation factor)
MSKIITTEFGRNSDLLKSMAWKLKEARHYSGLSQTQLAKKAKTTQSAISRAESGDISDTRNWLKLIKATGSDIQFHLSLETATKSGGGWTTLTELTT